MAQITDSLKEAADGLWVISETDAPFEIVSLGKIEQKGFDANTLIKVLNFPPNTTIETQEVSYFLRNMTTLREGADEDKVREVERFKSLDQLLLTQIKDVKVYRMGVRRIDSYILGWSDELGLVGLKTLQVDT